MEIYIYLYISNRSLIYVTYPFVCRSVCLLCVSSICVFISAVSAFFWMLGYTDIVQCIVCTKVEKQDSGLGYDYATTR